jgi:predicted CXXCH cytochrome family protein
MDHPPARQHCGTFRQREVMVAAAALAVTGALWMGCSVQKNYRMLSFFFDGVPNPNALPITGAAGGPGAMQASATYVAHKPYVEGKCDDCHQARFQLGKADSGICLKCHAGKPTEHPTMHGPVAASACLWCHVPHESAFASLLKAEPRKVCSQCHDSTMLSVDRVPAHAEAGRSCLECHTGHGGEARYFLRQARGADGAPAGRRQGE